MENKNLDEFGLPSLDYLHMKGMSKGSSPEGMNTIYKMYFNERYKKALEKDGEAYANADKLKTGVKHFGPRLSRGMNVLKLKYGNYLVGFMHRDYLARFEFGPRGWCEATLFMEDEDLEDGDDHTITEQKKFKDFNSFVDWFFNSEDTYWLKRNSDGADLLKESLNESPDEYGIPTETELADVYNKKVGSGLYRSNLDDLAKEYRDMQNIRKQERKKAIARNIGIGAANYDLLYSRLRFLKEVGSLRSFSYDEEGMMLEFSTKEDLPSYVTVSFNKDEDIVGVTYQDGINPEENLNDKPMSFTEFVNGFNKHRVQGGLGLIPLKDSLNESAVSNGVYSLYNGGVKEPEKSNIPEVDQYEVDEMVKPFIERYNQCRTIDDIDELIDDLYIMRQESIVQEGEYGIGNLAFKEFRSKGYLQKLKDKKVKLENNEMSLGGNYGK